MKKIILLLILLLNLLIGCAGPTKTSGVTEAADALTNTQTLNKPAVGQRFWTWINDQSANPWDSHTGKAMTWTLLDVHDNICRVGSDKRTNPYEGDTDLEAELPILCIRKQNLPVPNGVDPQDFYAGWSGGEIRLTPPIKGTSLKSLEVTNQFISQQFGPEWKMAEFHDTSKGGWSWWAYWRE
jgi:hypothetical protein